MYGIREMSGCNLYEGKGKRQKDEALRKSRFGLNIHEGRTN